MRGKFHRCHSQAFPSGTAARGKKKSPPPEIRHCSKPNERRRATPQKISNFGRRWTKNALFEIGHCVDPTLFPLWGTNSQTNTLRFPRVFCQLIYVGLCSVDALSSALLPLRLSSHYSRYTLLRLFPYTLNGGKGGKGGRGREAFLPWDRLETCSLSFRWGTKEEGPAAGGRRTIS